VELVSWLLRELDVLLPLSRTTRVAVADFRRTVETMAQSRVGARQKSYARAAFLGPVDELVVLVRAQETVESAVNRIDRSLLFQLDRLQLMVQQLEAHGACGDEIAFSVVK
jgi:hypothetical protein